MLDCKQIVAYLLQICHKPYLAASTTTPMKLYMILLGCRPEGRHIEQHDVYFDISDELPHLVPAIKAFWPNGVVHIDAWRTVSNANGNSITIVERSKNTAPNNLRLFFINLGGYKVGEFEEYHYKMVVAAADKGKAIQLAKRTAFYKHYGFPGASSHIDDKYGIDVDDAHDIEDILPTATRAKYAIVVEPITTEFVEDALHIGYFNLAKVAKGDVSSS